MTDQTDTPTRDGAVQLDQPIARGDTKIAFVQVRKPSAGELRGLSMAQLSQLDYGTLETLLPRITNPALTKQDLTKMDPADFMQLGMEVLDFLLPTSAKADAPQA